MNKDGKENHPLRIVVVDDEGGTRKGVIRLISRIDPSYVVVGEADNGYDGMLQIKALQPNVVIADIRMPRINGLEMIENAQPSSPDTRYLILSGFSEFELAKQAMRLSVVDYLLKPVTASQLADALSRLRILVQSDDNLPVGKTQVPSTMAFSPIVTHIVESIHRDFAQRLYLEDFADHLKITPEYAGSLFSKETGKSFSTYLRDVRMEKAKELLRDSDGKIYEISYKTGYADVKYFCRVFKDFTGLSPKAFARNLAERAH